MTKIALAALAFLMVAGWSFTTWRSRLIARAYPPSGSFVTLPGGGRLHYAERLPKGAATDTVLLLHGATGNQADLMLPLGDRLAARGLRVIAIDRPGHGWSDRPDGEADASPAMQAKMIAAALHQIGIDHAIVVGHSWAGALAVNLALDHRDVTRGLVLIAPVVNPWSYGVAWYYHAANVPVLGALFTHELTMPIGLASMQAGVAEVFSPQAPPPDFATRTGVYLVLRPAEFLANAQDMLGLNDFVTGQGPRMRTIAVPTAIVGGEDDRIASPDNQARRAAHDIPGATLLMLPDVGHSPHWAAPDKVADLIEEVAVRAAAEAHPLAAQ